jgi:formiminoglutamate deiminase
VASLTSLKTRSQRIASSLSTSEKQSCIDKSSDLKAESSAMDGTRTETRTWLFETALTPEGWRENVAVSVAPNGTITSVEPDAATGIRVAGAAIPGIANLHCHAFQRAMAGLTEQAGPSADSFWSWREQMYRFLDRMDPEDAEAVATFAYMEMLETGFTTVTEFHYVHHQPDGQPYADRAEMVGRHVAAAVQTGIGLTMLPVFYAHGNFGGAAPSPGQRRFLNSVDGFARLLDAAATHLKADPRMVLGLAPHSLRAATLDELRVVDGLLPSGPRHIHVSEQTKEVADCRAVHDTTPIALLADTVELSDRWCLIHATHATPDEVDLMARSGAVVGLCPVTEANLGDGIFPARDFLAKGGRFGVGTDSNVLIGLADELRQLEYSQRLAHRERNVLANPLGSTARRLFDAALAGGAQAAGLARAGIAVGARADIAVLDTQDAGYAALSGDALLDGFVFGSRGGVIRDVFAQGRHVVSHGRHVQRDAIERGFRAAMARMTAR